MTSHLRGFFIGEENMAGNDILSRIQVLLDADTANFSSGMQKAKGESKSTFESIRENANKMGAAVAAGATTALVALSAMAWETANHAAELEKYALRSNTTTQEFQKMAVGAQAYGVEQEKLSDMMKDFNEKLGEVTTIGAGGGVDFLEHIAVKTEGSAAAAEKLILKMQKLSGPEALQLYVDKLEEAGVTQQQMSFYLESMASDMTDLIPLLINGGDGMQLYSDAAERAGMVMSDETIAQAMILKEQMYLLDLQMLVGQRFHSFLGS
jgi:23S rRNA pseudoU1915 N3-methylase RlmH